MESPLLFRDDLISGAGGFNVLLNAKLLNAEGKTYLPTV